MGIVTFIKKTLQNLKKRLPQWPVGKHWKKRSTVRNSWLRSLIYPLASLPRANSTCQISLFWAGISSLMWHGPDIPLLGRTISLPGYSLPSRRKIRFNTNYVGRPLIAERDQRPINIFLIPAIKLLDRDTQQHIRQGVQNQWRILLDSSVRATSPQRFLSLLHKLGGKRSSIPLNISIAIKGKNPLHLKGYCATQSYRSALSQLHSGYCSRLQSYCHSFGWADDPTCPDCCSTNHTVAHLFSWPSHSMNLALGICGWHSSR